MRRSRPAHSRDVLCIKKRTFLFTGLIKRAKLACLPAIKAAPSERRRPVPGQTSTANKMQTLAQIMNSLDPQLHL